MGLQHIDSTVQIRTTPLVRRGINTEKQFFSLFYVFEYQDRSECGNIIVNVCKIGMDSASHVEGAPGRKCRRDSRTKIGRLRVCGMLK